MKKWRTCFLSLMLALAIVMSLALPADASTVSWTDGSDNYTVKLTVTDTRTVGFIVADAPKVKHTTGKETAVPYNGTYDCTLYGYPNCDSTIKAYESYVIQAMNKEGMLTKLRAYGTINKTFYVPAEDISGYYQFGVHFVQKEGDYSVYCNTTVLSTRHIQYSPVSYTLGLLWFVN